MDITKPFSPVVVPLKALVVTSTLTLFSTTALATPMGNYYEDWEGGDVAGWEQNTTSVDLSQSPTGGNPDGYLVSQRTPNDTDGFPIGASYRGDELSGDFSANSWEVSFDVNYIRGDFDDAWLRFRYHDATFNGWILDIENIFPQDEWLSYNILIDPTWSDADAMANGWMHEATAPSWAATMADVYYTEIRVGGSGASIVGIDNFRLTAVPEPGVLMLMAVGFLGLSSSMRRRNVTVA